MDREAVASMTLVSTTQTLTVFTALMPPLREVRQSNDPVLRDSVRTAEITATVIAGILGFGVSLATGSTTPFLVTLLTCGMFAGTYEFILSTTPPTTAKGTINAPA